MQEHSGQPAAPSDAELIASARGGDDAAADALFRRHQDAARRFARRLTDEASAEDLVSEAFTRVLVALRRGGGPDLALRPYLLTTIRNAHVTRVRREQRIVWVDDHEDTTLDPGTSDESGQRIESDLLARAFRSLPDRWQTVLWHTAVEDDDHATVGRLLGLEPNAISALAFRAREGLRRAYLEAHLATATDEACQKVRPHLPGYVRGAGGARLRRSVEDHLATCRACTAAVREAQSLNERLGSVLAPALVGLAYAGLHGPGVGGSGADVVAADRRHRPRQRTVTVAAVLAFLVGLGAWTLAVADSDPGTGQATRVHPGPGTTPTEAAPDPGDPDPTVAPATSRPSVSPSALGAPPNPTPVAPTAPPSTTPSAPTTPTGDAEPTSSPDPHHSPGTDGPSTTPDPDPDPSDPPDGWTRDDLRLVQGYQSDFDAYHHVQMRPESPFGSTYVRLRVPHLVGWTLHDESGYRAATCVDAASDDGATGLLCRVGSGDGLLGLDLTVDGPLDVLAEVFADENDDPHPANNVLDLTDA